jgi:hypothetical protein
MRVVVEQEPRSVVANQLDVDAHDRLIARVQAEQDDVLCTLSLCGHDDELAERLWVQLVDLLVESMFLDLRRDYLTGHLDRDAYVGELTAVADRCRALGLLPLPARGL